MLGSVLSQPARLLEHVLQGPIHMCGGSRHVMKTVQILKLGRAGDVPGVKEQGAFNDQIQHPR